MTVFQNFRQGGAAAGMGSDYSGSGSFRLVQGAFYHLMGHGIGKQHDQIRTSYLFAQGSRHLCKHFCFTVKLLTDFFVLADHPVMTSDDNDTHMKPPVEK